MTLDIYSHVIGGLQEAAAQRFDALLAARVVEHIGKMLAKIRTIYQIAQSPIIAEQLPYLNPAIVIAF